MWFKSWREKRREKWMVKNCPAITSWLSMTSEERQAAIQRMIDRNHAERAKSLRRCPVCGEGLLFGEGHIHV